MKPDPYFTCSKINLIKIKDVNVAAAAKLLRLCPTLCDPIDDSLPGSLVPGILQARILKWVAISFSRESLIQNHNSKEPVLWDSAFFTVQLSHPYMKVKMKVKLLSRVQLFVTPWTVAYQAPLSMGFSRQEY